MIRRYRTTSVRRGFTILELLIVVTMIGALAAISLGKTGQIMTGWRITRAAQAMSEEMQVAFALVGRNRKPVVIEFKTDSMNLVIRSRPDVSGNTTIFRRRNFGRDSEYHLKATDLTFSKPVTSNTVSLEVYPPGLAADSLSVTIARQNSVKRVRLLRGGLVQICTTGDASVC